MRKILVKLYGILHQFLILDPIFVPKNQSHTTKKNLTGSATENHPNNVGNHRNHFKISLLHKFTEIFQTCIIQIPGHTYKKHTQHTFMHIDKAKND